MPSRFTATIRSMFPAFLALALSLSASVPSLADTFSPDQTEAFERLIQSCLLSHPDVLAAAIRNMQQTVAQAPPVSSTEPPAKADLVVDAPVGGNPAGDVTIVEFFDYRCPYCKAAEPVVAELLRQDPNVRIADKEFPILGPASLLAARAALAARPQEKYEPFHRALMAAKRPLDAAAVMAIASETGLDTDRLRRDMDDPGLQQHIERNYDQADRLAIRGTPSFLIDGKLIPGATDLETLRRLVDAARRHG